MDIIQVLAAKLQSNMIERKFEINQILQNPLESDSLNRIENAIKQFVLLKSQFETATSFIQEFQKEEQREADVKKDED
jgi:hypothetical protein